MKLTVKLRAVILTVALLALGAGSAQAHLRVLTRDPAVSATRPDPVIVTAVSRWAAHQGGHVIYAEPWPVNPHRDLVTVQFSVTFEPSGLVGSETMTILAWRCDPQWIADGFAPVSMLTGDSRITIPEELAQ